MTVILAIDPGSEQSAWLVYNAVTAGIRAFAKIPNDELLALLRAGISTDVGVVAIEQIEPRYGLSPGWETLDTARWVGRFEEASHPTSTALLKRSEILRHLGVVTRGPNKTTADSGVRSSLIDRFGGKAAAVGVKAAPGPLHGIAKDVWSALAIAVTFADQHQEATA